MKKIILYATAVCSALCMNSCSDYLDKNPLNSPSDQTFLATETEMQMALASCYTALWTDFETMTFFLSFDEAADIGYDRNTSALQTMAQGASDANSDLAKNYWKAFYAGIAKCNYLLQNMSRGKDNVAPATYTQIKAEAQFLRALYYSYLIELYGDVPLITDVLTLETGQQPRNPKSEVVDFILKEYTEAAENLPSTNNPTSGRATKGAALALKARTALYNERWQEAISASQAVMTMEGTEYIIEDDYDSEFRYKGKPIPALQSLDRREKGIYMGTFSKSIAPAIRVSYLVLPRRLLTLYEQNCSFLSSTVSRIDQAVLNRFIAEGYFERYLNKMRKVYRQKQEKMLACLEPFRSCFTIAGEEAGLHILLMPKDKDVTEQMLIQKARQQGCKVYGLSDYQIIKKETHRVMLGYASLSLSGIEEGMGLLEKAWL
mgnify:CR=1 FL=1